MTDDQFNEEEQPGDEGWLSSLAVNRGSFLPLHRQIHDLVRQEIAEGRLSPGTRVHSESELAERWGVSLAPVRQAFADLAAEGYLDRSRGRGTFVRQPKFEEKLSILSSFTGSHADQGDRPELIVLHRGLVPAPPDVTAALGKRTPKLVLIQRLAYLDSSPAALLSSYLDPSQVPGIETGELEGGSIYRTLEAAYDIELVRADSTIESIRAGDDEGARLGVPTGTMLLRVDSVTYDRTDAAVEFSRVLYRMERFRFSLESHRLDGHVLHFPASGRRRGNSR
jgi:GntR family transcriptional regulator